MQVVISSGHGKYIRGASGILDEVDEARRVVEEVAKNLNRFGVSAITFHDNTSTTQDQNLHTIVDFHNSQKRDLDVSVHFNAYEPTDEPMGTECLYVSEDVLADEMSAAISDATDLPDRGAKYRGDLYFLNQTEMPAILIETCFVDSSADAEAYRENFEEVCLAIADTIRGRPISRIPETVPANQRNIIASVFGGGDDYNVSAYDETMVLNDTDYYVALPYRFTGTRPLVKVYNSETGAFATAEIWDVGPWLTDDDYFNTTNRPLAETYHNMNEPLPRGPNEGVVPNGAGIDLSPALAEAIGIDGMGEVDWEFTD